LSFKSKDKEVEDYEDEEASAVVASAARREKKMYNFSSFFITNAKYTMVMK